MLFWLRCFALSFALACTACGHGGTSTLPPGAALQTHESTPAAMATPAPTDTPVPSTEVSSPALGNWHDMVYHERAGQVVLVNGGPETGKPGTDPLELWGWDGTRWSLLSADPSGPRWRNFASVAYDTGRQVLVLYGGLQSETRQFAETWEWDGSAWVQRAGNGPGPREGAGMAYDSARGKVVLFGGAEMGRMMSDTWEWDGESWLQVATSGPPARFPGGFAYDAARARVLLFGGHAVDQRGFTTYGDTWLWDGAAWQMVAQVGPAPRDGARVVFDPQTETLLLLGGVKIDPGVEYFTDTWQWDGVHWQEVEASGPPGRAHPAMAHDLARGRIVLAGGSNAPGVILPDVWEWDGQAWACVYRCE